MVVFFYKILVVHYFYIVGKTCGCCSWEAPGYLVLLRPIPMVRCHQFPSSRTARVSSRRS